ncbi:MAG TPA: hypothetical protein VGN95_09255 [Pyrinomonadaceae bacterium]|nr:hypothetical protein [Pyrinomonadaceae bacterium]
MHDTTRPVRWRLGIFAALALTLLALYPQFRLQLTRGRDWNGSFAFFSQDEIAYSAYVNALIEGRPRLSDPYTGRDDAPGAPQHESLFSIQFAPAYAIAIPARVFGLSAPTSFIALTALVAFASALALFWLIGMATNDERVAAAGALVVLCLGTFAILYAPLRQLFGLDTTYTFEYFPFLRRYVPAVSFPFFFVFCALVWRALTSQSTRSRWAASLLAGLSFAFLVFSYFYLWTAAAAWLVCFALLWLVARTDERATAIRVFSVIVTLAIIALVPYFLLLQNRAPTMDSVQLLAISHAPDFSRSSIKLGLIVCAVLAYSAWRGRIKWRTRTALFATSFALTPLLLFNQQIITGRSLQPLHYELYLAKYLALLALVLAIALLRPMCERTQPMMTGRIFACFIVVALGWGMIETGVETKRHAWASLDRDEALIVARRLAELSRASTTHAPDNQQVVLYFNLDHADISPVVAPQPVLWAPHTPAFSGVTTEENRQRLYQYLYYTNEDLWNIDERRFDMLDYRKNYLIHSLIEWGHNDPAWTVNWKQITPDDVSSALRGYRRYVESFSREQAENPTLSYVVTEGESDLKNLDRWYERDAGEPLGRFTLYRLRLK